MKKTNKLERMTKITKEVLRDGLNNALLEMSSVNKTINPSSELTDATKKYVKYLNYCKELDVSIEDIQEKHQNLIEKYKSLIQYLLK